MKLAVIGSRTFNDKDLLYKTIDELRITYPIDAIVSGGAKGADSMGIMYAEYHGLFWTEYLPNWGLYGKSAGFRRNHNIINDADIVVAFWDGKSRGTKHSIDLTKTLNKPVFIVPFAAKTSEDA